jgi:hypothetical protein
MDQIWTRRLRRFYRAQQFAPTAVVFNVTSEASPPFPTGDSDTIMFDLSGGAVA